MGGVVADLIVRVRGEGGGAINEMNRVQRRFDGLAKGMRATGGMIKGIFTTAFGFAAGQLIASVGRVFASVGSAAVDFGRQMANVNSIAHLGADEFEQLQRQVIELSRDPRISDAPNTLAKGLYQIVSSGFQANDAMIILEASSIAASAGLTTTEVSAGAVTAVLNAYGLKATEATTVSDSLFQTVNLGVITFEQLAGTVGRVLPLSSALGVSLDEVGASYATMTRQGLDADESTTRIVAVMTELLNPTEALTAAVQEMGYTSAYAMLKQEGWSKTLNILGNYINGDTELAAKLFNNVRALGGITTLTTDDGNLYNQMLKEQKQAHEGAGATAKALEEQMKSLAYALAQIRKNGIALATVMLKLVSPGLASAGRGVAGFLNTLVGMTLKFGDFMHLMKEAFGPATSIHNILDSIFGEKALGGPMLGSVLTTNTGKAYEFVKSLLLIADSFGHIARAFQEGGITGGFDEIGNQWDRIKEQLKTIAGLAFDLAIDVTVNIKNWLLGQYEPIADWLDKHFSFGNDPQPTQGGAHGKFAGTHQAINLYDVPVQIASWAWNGIAATAGDIWDYVMSQLGVQPNGQGQSDLGDLGSGTGGGTQMGTKRNGVSLSDVAINILNWGQITIVQSVWSFLSEWVPKGVAKAEEAAVVLKDVAIRVLNWGETTGADTVWAWLSGIINGGEGSPAGNIPILGQATGLAGSGVYLENVPVHVKDWKLEDVQNVYLGLLDKIGIEASTPEAIAAAKEKGKEQGKEFGDNFFESFVNSFKGGGEGGEGEGMAHRILTFDLTEWIPDTQLDVWDAQALGFGQGIGQAMWDGLVGAIRGPEGVKLKMPFGGEDLQTGLGMDAGGPITEAISGFLQPLTDFFNGAGDIADDISSAFGTIADGFTGGMDKFSPVLDTLGGLVDRAEGLLERLHLVHKEIDAETVADIATRAGSGGGPHGPFDINQRPIEAGPPLPGEDPGGHVPVGLVQTVTIKADDKATSVLEDIKGKVAEFVAQKHESPLGFNTAPAIDALFSVVEQANAFAGTTYTATVAFTVDTTGLAIAEAQALATARFISDVLHTASPARKGPLHDRYPDFKSLGKDFAAVSGQIKRDAWSTAGAISEMDKSVSRTVGSTGNRASGGSAKTFNIFALKSDELVKLMRDAESFSEFAREINL